MSKAGHEIANEAWDVLRERINTERAEAAAIEREACAAHVEAIKMQEVLLAAGEMTAQERRTVRALLPWLANRIRNRNT